MAVVSSEKFFETFQPLHLEIGEETPASVRAFQKAHKLIADGIVGEKTLAALDALFL